MLALVYIVYYILATISLLCSLYVFFSLIRSGSFKSSFTLLLAFLHGSLAMEIITILPYAYTYSDKLCSGMEFLHEYFSFMDILVVALLVESHRSALLKDYFGSRKLILKYGVYLIILFPGIIALAFIDNQFQATSTAESAFCDTRFSGSLWALGLYSFWVWLLLFISVFSTIYSLCRIYDSDHLLAKKFLSSIGLYVIVAMNSWLPRAIERAVVYTHPGDHTNHFVSSYPYVISGILYTIIYLRERQMLNVFSEMGGDSTDAQSVYSWEHSELSEFDRSLRRTGHTASSRSYSASSFNPFLNFNNSRRSSVEMSQPAASDNV